MRFTKMQGIGNDYIYIDGSKEQIDDIPKLSIELSDRHFGIGGDGIIMVNPSDKADCAMDIYNADGSRAQMCGNGIRCVAKYAKDHGMVDGNVVRIETLSGIKTVNILENKGNSATVRVDMGAPMLSPPDMPADFEGHRIINETLEVGKVKYKVTCVSMGNPHCVIFMEDDINSLEIERLGPLFENHERFPERINTEFVNVLDDSTLSMRVWERGSCETMACGTGACAVLVAAVLNDKAKREAAIRLKGGSLDILWDEKDGHVYMTGEARKVFDGEI